MTALVLIWGTAFVSIKVLGQHLDPFQLTWYRYVPLLVLSVVWLPLRRRDRFAKVSGADWLRFGLAGVLGVLGYHLPLNYGTSTVSADPITGGMAAVLVASTPLWTLLYVRISGQEALTPRKLAGAAVAFIGVSLVVFLGRPDAQGPDAARTALVVLLAPIFWGLYSVVAKPLIARHGGLFTTALTMGIGTLTLLPAGLSYGTAPLADFGAAEWFWLAYLSIAATVGGYIIWNQSLKRRSAAQVTSYIFAIPVVATLAGAILIGERITAWFVAGSALVLLGLWWVQNAPTQAKDLKHPADSPTRGRRP